MVSIRTSQAPSTSGADSIATVGTVFTVDAAGYESTGARYWKYATPHLYDGLSVQMGLWAGSTLIASTSRTQLVGDSAGWINLTWSTPVTLSTGITYTVGFLMPAGGYSYLANGLSAAIDNPPLHSVATGGRYSYGGTLQLPTTTTSTDFFADVIADATPAGTVVAVRMTGTGAMPAPAVSGNVAGAVTAVRMVGTGEFPAPIIDAAAGVTGGGPMTGTGLMRAPTVTGSGSATVVAVRATGTGLLRAPVVTGGTVATLPAVVTFGAVKGWLAQGVNQAPDADGYADLVADQGTVTFKPAVNVLLFPSASPAPLILTPVTVVATLDADGYLIGTKTGGTEKLVRLIVGTWTVSYQLTGVTLPSHPVTITGGETVDLVTVIPT